MKKENRSDGVKSTLEAEKSVFEKKCYEAYKLRWMIAHGDTLKELFNTIGDIVAESVEDYPGIVLFPEQVDCHEYPAVIHHKSSCPESSLFLFSVHCEPPFLVISIIIFNICSTFRSTLLISRMKSSFVR